jgi:hypothetical protein
MGRHRVSTGRHGGGGRWRVPRVLRHATAGHRASPGCMGWLLVGVVVLVALIVDTPHIGA